MRVSIFGVGAVGGLLAATLSHYTDAEIHLHVRGIWGSNLLIHGLQVESESTISVPPEAFDISFDEHDFPPTLEHSSDVALICSKAPDLERLLPIVVSTLKPNGIVCILSNGLGLVEIARRHLPPDSMIYTTTTHGAYRTEDRIIWAGKGAIQIGTSNSAAHHEAVEQFIALLEQAQLNPETKEDGRAMIWEKALMNVSINPIAALTGKRNGELLSTEIFQHCMNIFKEAATIARYEGIEVADELNFEKRLTQVLQSTSENQCSMLQDIQFGRKTEIDFLNGKIVDLAEKHGIPAPLNAILTSMVRSCHP